MPDPPATSTLKYWTLRARPDSPKQMFWQMQYTQIGDVHPKLRLMQPSTGPRVFYDFSNYRNAPRSVSFYLFFSFSFPFLIALSKLFWLKNKKKETLSNLLPVQCNANYINVAIIYFMKRFINIAQLMLVYNNYMMLMYTWLLNAEYLS